MLARIALKKPKLFGKLDFTSGYFQTPLAEEFCKFTAFITFMGVYEFLRAPMGLKGSGSYFQQVMATIVLAGLLYKILELYIDDVLVYAQTEEEYLKNMEDVLIKLRKHNVTVHPDKMISGVTQIDFVGRTIGIDPATGKYGATMAPTRIQEIIDFPKPITLSLLRSFLGLANYFRPHIRYHADIVEPLQKMVNNAVNQKPNKGEQYRKFTKTEKNASIDWTPEAEKAFEEIKEKIATCPTLYFNDQDGKVVLYTDASEYGYGAYLCQVIDGKEYPTNFISKSFNKDQRRWSTPEKEMFAIYYAVKHFDHLLRDIKFTLKTDHDNLTKPNIDNAKVMRWKIFIQEYDYTAEYIPGPENIVADAFSRLCINDKTLETAQLLNAQIEINEESQMFAHEIFAANETRQKIPDPIYKLLGKLHNTQAGHVGVEKTTQRSENALNRFKAHFDNLPNFKEEMKVLKWNGIKTVKTTVRNNDGTETEIESQVAKDIPDEMAQELMTELKKWRFIRNDCREFLRRCPCCQKMNRIKIPIHTKPYILSGDAPMQKLNVDLIGPLPIDTKGNKYILVIIDMFTRFTELIPVPDATAETTAAELFRHFGRYGAAEKLWSDNGPNFISHIIKELLEIIGTEHHLTLSYSHEENAIVERANKEVGRHLRNIVFHYKLKKDWSILLPLVMRLMNSEVHSALGISPSQMLFGNQIILDRGIFLPSSQRPIPHSAVPAVQTNNRRKKKDDQIVTLSNYTANMIRLQADLILVAQRSQKDLNLFHINQRDHRQYTEYAPNSYVLVEYEPIFNSTTRRGPTKIHAPLRGPMKVVSNIGGSYTLKNLITNQDEVHHISKLREFVYDEALVDPHEVAKSDTLEYLVEKIVKHDGEWTKRSEMGFLVKWAGFSEERNTWVKWEDIKLNPTLHEYMRDQGPAVAKLIPQNL
jgi:hypothetical protein